MNKKNLILIPIEWKIEAIELLSTNNTFSADRLINALY